MRTFGYLTIVKKLPSDRRGVAYLCKCSCGNEKRVSKTNLVNGYITSCGCRRRLAGGHTANGKSPTYRSWEAMHQRCQAPNSIGYANYGGRGIKVCKRWSGENGFLHFLADMGERPPEMSIDRFPDNDGNYEPSNCRWATRSQQSNKRSKTDAYVEQIRKLVEAGCSFREVARQFGITHSTVSKLARIW